MLNKKLKKLKKKLKIWESKYWDIYHNGKDRPRRQAEQNWHH